MNKTRRLVILGIISKLEEIQAAGELLRDDECEAFGNLPESLQGSDSGIRIEEAHGSLIEAVESVEYAIDFFRNSIGG